MRSLRQSHIYRLRRRAPDHGLWVQLGSHAESSTPPLSSSTTLQQRPAGQGAQTHILVSSYEAATLARSRSHESSMVRAVKLPSKSANGEEVVSADGGRDEINRCRCFYAGAAEHSCCESMVSGDCGWSVDRWWKIARNLIPFSQSCLLGPDF